jgi:hypothetical protein
MIFLEPVVVDTALRWVWTHCVDSRAMRWCCVLTLDYLCAKLGADAGILVCNTEYSALINYKCI